MAALTQTPKVSLIPHHTGSGALLHHPALCLLLWQHLSRFLHIKYYVLSEQGIFIVASQTRTCADKALLQIIQRPELNDFLIKF